MANVNTMMPWVFPQFPNDNLAPAAGYRLFTYEAGTSTKLATYQTSTSGSGSVAHSNPITLDSSGQPPAPIFLAARSYKFVLAPPGSDDPPTTTIRTSDNVAATPPFDVDTDVTGTAGETLDINEWVYLSAGDGGRTAGRYYKTDADLDYASTTARIVGVCMTTATAGGTITVRRLGRVTGLSGLTAGSPYYLSATAGAITATAPSNTRRVGVADGTTTLVVAAEIEEPIKGYLALDLTVARELSGGAIQNAAANGGILASDSTPILQRVNGATDQALRINWAAGNSDVITWSFVYPPDWDDLNPVTVHLLAAMAGSSDTPAMAVAYFEGVGDSNAGGNTAAITGTSVAEYTRTIAAADIGSHPNFASVSLTPGTHATDALFLYGISIEYVRKLKST